MTTKNMTVEILKQIRDEIRDTRVELSGRIDRTREELSGRIDQTNFRLGSVEGALLELATQQRFVVRYVTAIGDRDSRLDGEVADLRVRVEALEAKADVKSP